jgi:hypothetical protein
MSIWPATVIDSEHVAAQAALGLARLAAGAAQNSVRISAISSMKRRDEAEMPLR